MEQRDEPVPEDQQGLRGAARSLRSGFGWLYDFIDSATSKVQNLTETNYQLACDMAMQGRVENAIGRFKLVLWMTPNHVPSLYNLGCIYHHKQMDKEALDCFAKVLKIQPNHVNAIYMVASINPALLKPQVRPKQVPYEMIHEYFEATAARYDYLQQSYGYQLPALMHQMLHTELPSSMVKHDLLDLGCGTGLCGFQFQGEFANTVGVDISSAMLDQAYRRMDRRGVKVYTRLLNQDMRRFLYDSPPEAYDLVICISAFRYLGDLNAVFAGVTKVLRMGSLFACSFDSFDQQGDYGVMPKTGYFGHSLEYVIRYATHYGFDVVRTGEVLAYPNVHRQLCFFRKARNVAAAQPAHESAHPTRPA